MSFLAIDAIGTEVAFTSAASSVSSSTSINVGAGANKLIAGWLGAGTVTAGTISATWAGSSLSSSGAVGLATDGVNFLNSALLYLDNPASGLQTLTFNWTGGTLSGFMFAMSFDGVPAGLSGLGATNASGTSALASVTAGSGALLPTDYYVALFGSVGANINSVTGSKNFIDNSLAKGQGAVAFGVGALTLSAPLASSVPWLANVIDVTGNPATAFAAGTPTIARVSQGGWIW